MLLGLISSKSIYFSFKILFIQKRYASPDRKRELYKVSEEPFEREEAVYNSRNERNKINSNEAETKFTQVPRHRKQVTILSVLNLFLNP